MQKQKDSDELGKVLEKVVNIIDSNNNIFRQKWVDICFEVGVWKGKLFLYIPTEFRKRPTKSCAKIKKLLNAKKVNFIPPNDSVGEPAYWKVMLKRVEEGKFDAKK